MTIFRELSNNGSDRSIQDRNRHRKLVEDSIKKNITDIIAEESIIGKGREKKIKIPIRGIKEYKFIYGENNPNIGSGTGDEKKGDKIGEDRIKNKNGQVGNNEGEEIYEMEITIDELLEYLFDDLNLPYLDRKKFNEIESSKEFKRIGYVQKGINSRLAMKKSMIERIKRKKAFEKAIKENPDIELQNDYRFPFKEEDLRYHRLREDKKLQSNAVIVCIMDTSGSMTINKKYLARTFYFLMYQFIKLKYANVEIIFISHTTKAKEVNEDEFFHRGESGGTYISSGYKKALDIIEERFNPSVWNIYTFHISDGDNWAEDNSKSINLAKQLCDKCNLFGYGEINQGYFNRISTFMDNLIKNIKNKNFTAVTILRKEDIIPALRKILDSE